MASPPIATYERVYVWEFPVRFYHWTNAICVVTLILTGFLIGHPVSIFYASEAYQLYWFGTVRFTHFVAAFLFFFTFMVRLYWGFVGNPYAKWTNFVPYRREQFHEMGDIIKVDILQTKAGGEISIGHDALAGFIYFLSFLAFLFQSATGFALYAGMSHAWLPHMFTWIVTLMGGDFRVRQWHHAMMWFFILFAIVHIYLVFYHDYSKVAEPRRPW